MVGDEMVGLMNAVLHQETHHGHIPERQTVKNVTK
jgi:hypothetical protein